MALADAAPYAEVHWTLDEASGNRADSIGSNTLVDSNTVGVGTGKFGNAADFERDNSESFSCTSSDALKANTTTMWRFWLKPESLTSSQYCVFCKRTEIGADEYRLVLTNLGSGYQFSFSILDAAGTGGTSLFANNFGVLTAGNWYLVHVWHDVDADELGISVNGVTDTKVWSSGGYDGSTDFRMGFLEAGAFYLDGLVDDFVILKGYILDSTEIAEDYNSGDGVAYADWAPSGVTLTADPGSYSLTGTAASLEQGYSLSAESGTFTLSGTSANLLEGSKITADPGSYSLSGQAASLLQGYEVSADAGSYSQSGANADLIAGLKLPAEAGAYIVTGQIAGLEQGYEVSAESGVYSLSGTDAAFVIGTTITADPGSYSLAGTAAGLLKQWEILATPGSYVLAGTDAVLEIEGRAVTGGRFVEGDVYQPGFAEGQIMPPGFQSAGSNY